MDFVKCLEIKKASYYHYLRLAHYHYVKSSICPYHSIYGVYGRNRYHEQYPRPVAVVVYAPPMPNLRGRNTALDGILDIPSKPKDRMPVINRNIIYASRLICDPRFGRQGIASWLLRSTIHLPGKPIVESLSPIDDEASLLTRIGFRSIIIPTPVHYTRVISCLLACGITEELLKFPGLVHRRIESMSGPQRVKLDYELQRFIHHFSHHEFQVHNLKRTEYIVSKLMYPSWYHIWIDKNWLKTRGKSR